MTNCTIHIKSEIVCIVRGLTIEHRHEMHDRYNFYIDNYINHPRVVAGLWDGKKSFFTLSGTTYTLLLEYLVKDLIGMGYGIDIVDDTKPMVHVDFKVEPDIFCDCFDKYGNPFKLRGYQCDSANLLLEYGNGIIEAATSAGKGSMICAISKAIISTTGFKMIIIVPNTTLITQSIEECKQYNIDVGEFSGSVKDLNHPVVVSTWQTLKNSPKVLGQFSALICDECHSGKADILNDLLINHASHITLRFGVTGTIPKNKAQKFSILSALGPVRKKITAKWLQDNGYISTINIHNIVVTENSTLTYFPDYDKEVEHLEREYRLDFIVDFIKTIHEDNLSKNILVLMNHKKVGTYLAQHFDKSFYIDGGVKASKRLDHLKRYASEDGVIGFGTFGVASTGVSQDRIHIMVTIDIGKSFIRVIQSIGRGLRKGGGKQHIDLYDIGSNLLYSQDHLNKRLVYYREAEYPYTTIKIPL